MSLINQASLYNSGDETKNKPKLRSTVKHLSGSGHLANSSSSSSSQINNGQSLSYQSGFTTNPTISRNASNNQPDQASLPMSDSNIPISSSSDNDAMGNFNPYPVTMGVTPKVAIEPIFPLNNNHSVNIQTNKRERDNGIREGYESMNTDLDNGRLSKLPNVSNNLSSNVYSNYNSSYSNEMPIKNSMMQQQLQQQQQQQQLQQPYLKSNTKLNTTADNTALLEKLNHIINILEKQQVEPTQNSGEEFVSYMFLGIFIIYIVDSFTRVGKYIR